ncbi:hypothetical protein CKA32_004458 [Geitlerinema sp. FC II]|nr:hypothetical protein CKA32_004458 [Geitlerinema sp. FC II]
MFSSRGVFNRPQPSRQENIRIEFLNGFEFQVLPMTRVTRRCQHLLDIENEGTFESRIGSVQGFSITGERHAVNPCFGERSRPRHQLRVVAQGIFNNADVAFTVPTGESETQGAIVVTGDKGVVSIFVRNHNHFNGFVNIEIVERAAQRQRRVVNCGLEIAGVVVGNRQHAVSLPVFVAVGEDHFVGVGGGGQSFGSPARFDRGNGFVPASGIGFAFKGAIGRVDVEYEKLTVRVAAIGFRRIRGGKQTSSVRTDGEAIESFIAALEVQRVDMLVKRFGVGVDIDDVNGSEATVGNVGVAIARTDGDIGEKSVNRKVDGIESVGFRQRIDLTQSQ